MPTKSPTDFARILAIETATSVQAVALIDGEELCEHRVRKVAYNHGSTLLKNVDDVLESCQLELEDIDLFAVGLGPGSFTGLRVGLATAKGLSRATQRPIVGISSLAALAYGPARACPQATVLATIDARRREVYAGAYRWERGELACRQEDGAFPPAKWRECVQANLDGPLVQVGNGVERYESLRQWDHPDLQTLPPLLVHPSALSVALLGRDVARRQGTANRTELEPNYIRPSDARLPEKAPGPMPPPPNAES